jgi:hypothetical protein
MTELEQIELHLKLIDSRLDQLVQLVEKLGVKRGVQDIEALERALIRRIDERWSRHLPTETGYLAQIFGKNAKSVGILKLEDLLTKMAAAKQIDFMYKLTGSKIFFPAGVREKLSGAEFKVFEEFGLNRHTAERFRKERARRIEEELQQKKIEEENENDPEFQRMLAEHAAAMARKHPELVVEEEPEESP